MPQLDKVTFLSQFFWLCFFYLGLYYIILKIYLPKISRIVALRQRKMVLSQQGMSSVHQENQLLREQYQMALSQAFLTCKQIFTQFFSRTTNWLDTTVMTVNNKHYKQVNTLFLKCLGETSLSHNMLFYHAETTFPDKVFLKGLVNYLKTRTSKSTTTATTRDISPQVTIRRYRTRKT